MKKKLSLGLTVLISALFLVSCTTKTYEDYQGFQNGSVLQRGKLTYTFHGPLPDDSLRGKQIGIVDGDKKDKVYELKGFSADEWIIEYYDVVMSVYTVYKADTVTEIPDVLK